MRAALPNITGFVLSLLLLLGCGSNSGSEPGSSISNEGAVVSGNADGDATKASSVAAGATAGRGAVAGENSKASNAVRVEQSMILDPNGFGRPMVAATLFVPHGWQTNGGVVWGQQFACTNGYGINWSATAPDGLSGMAVIPQQKWQASSTGQALDANCPMAELYNAESYVRSIITTALPNARITQVRNREDLVQESAHLNGVQDTGFQRIETWVEAVQAYVDYQEQGVPMRGSLVAAVQFTRIRTGGQYSAAIENFSGYANPSFASFGPADRYDAAVYEGLRKSILVNPAWEAEISGHNNKMGQIARKGIMDRANIQYKSSQDLMQIQNETWANQQKSSDLRAREFIEYVRDVEPYNAPAAAGGQVQLSSFYDQAWRLDDGTYVLTSDPSFQPYRTYGVQGERLGVTR